MLTFDKDKTSMEVLCNFRKIISTDYKEGGWLPSVRTMSEQLNVSPVTCRKAIKHLVSESIAKSFPRKGIYIVPEKYRRKKIGLVVGDGEESPFVMEVGMLSGLLKKLNEFSIACHLLQGSPIMNVARSAITHCVGGVIWIDPSPNSIPVVNYLYKNNITPVLVANGILAGTDDTEIPEEFPCVREDFSEACLLFPKLFIERGHKNLLFSGHAWMSKQKEIDKILKQAGLGNNKVFYLDEDKFSTAKTIDTVISNNITAMRLEGTEERLATVFRALSGLPADKQPEVMVRKCPNLQEIMEAYPKVRLAAVVERDMSMIGEAAAEKMIEHLDTGRPMGTTEVFTYKAKFTD